MTPAYPPQPALFFAEALRVLFLKLGLMPVAELLHRNQTPCPTRTTPSGLCTEGRSPDAPVVSVAQQRLEAAKSDG